MKKRYKIGLVLIVVLIIIIISIGLYVWLKPHKEEIKNTTSIISDIKDFGYSLDDRDTPYMEEEFNILKEVLNQEEINYEDYAKSLAKLFIIDFYTLNNKINKYDVGSVEYIYKEKQDDFRRKALDTIYNDIIDNTYLDRVQDLPEVNEVVINSIEEVTEKVGDKEYNGYLITVNIGYKKDFGYDTEGTINIINNEGKLEIIKYEPTINE